MISAPNPLLAQAIAQYSGRRKLVAGFDLAFVNDGCALVMLEHESDRVVEVDRDYRVPRPGQPFDPDKIADEYIDRVADAGCKLLVSDVHYLEILRVRCLAKGIALFCAPGFDERTKAWVTARHYTRARALKISRELSSHLAKIKLIVNAGGKMSIVAPRGEGSGAGHADLAFAFVGALWLDVRSHGLVGSVQAIVKAHKGRWESP